MEIEKKYDIVTVDIIDEVTKIAKTKRPDSAPEEVEEYENFLFYSDAKYPRVLIDSNRPNEDDIVKEYRRKTYQAVFCEVFDRVLNALNKIQRADGFYLKYPDQSQFTKIAKDEKLDIYLNEHFTPSKSLMNWAFQVGLKQYIIDSNCVIILWSKKPEDETTYHEPVPLVINSDKILYSWEGHTVIWRDEYDSRHTVYSIDSEAWRKFHKDKKNRWVLEDEIYHELGMFPGFTMGGIIKEEDELGREYESRFKAMLPWLNVATIEFSDLRAEITQHIHSTTWIYQDEQCPTCVGMGYLMKDNNKVPCTNQKCKGGQIPVSPYETLRVRPAKTNMGEQAAPTPPMGYIQKQTQIAELQDKRINEMRYRSLAAINMQFLETLPEAQSGVAKAYDRDETNNTFYGVAIDLGRMMENIAFFVAKWRYNLLYNNDELKEMCPICIVPNHFDILGSQLIVEEIKSAKDSSLNDAILSEMELEFIKKRFPNDVAMQRKMRSAFELDPASGKSDEEKALLVTNRMMSKNDAVVSTYIFDFIERAFAENENFAALDRKAQRAVLARYADEKLKDINAKDKISAKIFGLDNIDAESSTGKSPADLKYTVGGLTGIIEIVKAVSSGVYDLEAAIQMVMDRFGLTYEQAKAQLGTPQIVTTPAEVEKITKLT